MTSYTTITTVDASALCDAGAAISAANEIYDTGIGAMDGRLRNRQEVARVAGREAEKRDGGLAHDAALAQIHDAAVAAAAAHCQPLIGRRALRHPDLVSEESRGLFEAERLEIIGVHVWASQLYAIVRRDPDGDTWSGVVAAPHEDPESPFYRGHGIELVVVA